MNGIDTAGASRRPVLTEFESGSTGGTYPGSPISTERCTGMTVELSAAAFAACGVTVAARRLPQGHETKHDRKAAGSAPHDHDPNAATIANVRAPSCVSTTRSPCICFEPSFVRFLPANLSRQFGRGDQLITASSPTEGSW